MLDHASLQPLRDHSPGGERAELVEDVVVGDAVKRPGQIGVQNPWALRALALGDLEPGLDRVMAAAARPEPEDLRSNLASHSGSSALTTRAWWHRSTITGTVPSNCTSRSPEFGFGG